MGSSVEAENSPFGDIAMWIRNVVERSHFMSLFSLGNHVSYLQFPFQDLHGHGDDISGLLPATCRWTKGH